MAGDSAPLERTLELARAADAGEPYSFRFEPQTYNVRRDDGTYDGAPFPWSGEVLADLAACNRPQPDPIAEARLGALLAAFLARFGWRERERELLAATGAGRAVHLTIRAAAAELYALPWELTALPTTGQRLGALPGCLLRYEWPGTETAGPVPDPPPEGGRLLFAWSAAGGAVPAAGHLAALRGACTSGHLPFDPERDVVAHASRAGLRAALGAGPVAALHLLCHGGRLRASSEAYGLLCDAPVPGGEPDVLDPEALRELLRPHLGRLRLVVLAACHGASAGDPGNAIGSVAQALHRLGIPAVVASRRPMSAAGSITLTEVLYARMLGGLESLEAAFMAARRRLVEDATGDADALQLYARAADGPEHRPFVVRPYRGLLAFRAEHAPLFFGRQAEVAEAARDLAALVAGRAAPRFLLVTGASGTGKSSIVLAGLVPALRRGGDWQVTTLRPRDGVAGIEAAVAGRGEGTLLLVVDQLEEVFTDVADREARAAFVRRLWSLAGSVSASVAVVATLRVDFLARCGELSLGDGDRTLEDVAYDEAHRVFVAQMGPAALVEAIVRPAARVGLRVEVGLAERLVREVRGEGNALPLLSYVLDDLWRRRRGDALTHAALDAAGGVLGALSRHADAAVDALDAASRAHARRALVRLVRFGSDPAFGVRQRGDLEEMRSRVDPEGWERAIEALVAARLLVRREADDARITLEIAHEAIIRHWQRLWTWYREDRDRLARVAELGRLVEQWRQYGPLGGKALVFGQALAAGLDGEDVPAEARRMLDASAALDRRRRWLRRGLVGGAMVVLVVFAVVVTVLGLRAAQSAEQAERSARRARAASRVAAAERFLEVRPHLAAALLRGVDPADAAGWFEAAVRVLQAPLPEVTPVAGLGIERLVHAPDGALIAADTDGRLRVIPPGATPGPVSDEPGGRVLALAAAPAGDLVFVARADGLEVWRRADLRLTRVAAAPLELAGEVRLHPGARTPRVVVQATDESTWALIGDRLERQARREAPCLRIEARTELRMCPTEGTASVHVESWTGEIVARADEAAAPGGESTDLRAWWWSGDAEPPRPRTIPAEQQRGLVDQVFTGAEQTVFAARRDLFGLGGVELCSLPVGPAVGARCVALDVGCAAREVVGQEVVVRCADRLVLRRVEDPALSQELRGPEAMGSAVAVDPWGREVAALDPDRLWRWSLRARPSGATVVGEGWRAPFPEVPRLQADRGRVVAVLGGGSAPRLLAWSLDEFPALAAPLALAIPAPRLDPTNAPQYAVAGDAVFVPLAGEGQAWHATLRARRIDRRTLAGFDAERDGVVAVSGDGEWALAVRGAQLVRLDLRGESPVDAGLAPYEGVGVVADTRVERALRLRLDGPAAVIELVTGAVHELPPGWREPARAAAWSPSGRRLAVGFGDGRIVVLDVTSGALTPLRALDVHREAIQALHLADDGRLVGVDATGTIVVWPDLQRDEAPRLVFLGPAELSEIGLDLGRGRLWGLTPLGALHAWSVVDDPGAAARALASRPRYCPTAEEWARYTGAEPDEAAALARDACPAGP